MHVDAGPAGARRRNDGLSTKSSAGSLENDHLSRGVTSTRSVRGGRTTPAGAGLALVHSQWRQPGRPPRQTEPFTDGTHAELTGNSGGSRAVYACNGTHDYDMTGVKTVRVETRSWRDTQQRHFALNAGPPTCTFSRCRGCRGRTTEHCSPLGGGDTGGWAARPIKRPDRISSRTAAATSPAGGAYCWRHHAA